MGAVCGVISFLEVLEAVLEVVDVGNYLFDLFEARLEAKEWVLTNFVVVLTLVA